MSAPIYLDNHSATAPCAAALAAGSLVLDGRLQFLYEFAGAKPEDSFAFATSGAEAIQQVFFSAFLELARKEGKCHFATSCLEDAPTLMGLKRLEELGCFVKIAPAKQGCIDVDALKELINPRTALVSISAAQGLTGVIQPVHEIAALCKEKGALLHVDATMAVGKMILDFDCDYLTFSGDRIHSVKSSAALFAKAGRPLVPLWPGGSVDTASLLSLCAAAQQSALYLDIMGLEVARLKALFEQCLLERIVDAKILFADAARLPNVSAIAFPHVHQESLLYLLQRKGIAATIGGTSSPHLSRLLIASGVEEPLASSAISFALSRQTTEEEVLRAVNLIADAVEHLRRFSGDLF